MRGLASRGTTRCKNTSKSLKENKKLSKEPADDSRQKPNGNEEQTKTAGGIAQGPKPRVSQFFDIKRIFQVVHNCCWVGRDIREFESS